MATQTTTTTTSQPSETVSQLRFDTSINYNENEVGSYPLLLCTNIDIAQYKYSHYLPHSKPGLQPPLEEFKHTDPGLRADPAKAALLNAPGSSFQEITPAVGTEVHGLQLSSLDSKQKDELALLVAERGVLVFRGQDFADIGFEKQKEFGAHFGKLHVHQHGGHVKDYPELLPVYRDFTYVLSISP